ncbi:MAG TPA: oligoendopeptidase F, partial [Rhodoblastus sp.]|nr:oligoendopeptidase F [Rhodoblastus sp.]
MTATAELGPLPEWNLADLYSGLDSPQFVADLARAEQDCRAFAAKWRGKLAEAAHGEHASARLAEALRE